MSKQKQSKRPQTNGAKQLDRALSDRRFKRKLSEDERNIGLSAVAMERMTGEKMLGPRAIKRLARKAVEEARRAALSNNNTSPRKT